VALVIGNGSFVAALALLAEDLAPTLGQPAAAPGYWIGVPNWHAMLLCANPGADAPAVLAEMQELNAKLFDYTDAVSAEIYRLTPRQAGAEVRLPQWTLAGGALLG
jgi:hypothetical protein